MSRKIFYDFEVFMYDWMVVLIDYDSRAEKVIVNDVNELRRVYTKHKNDIWIGYNSRMYDQFIMKGTLHGLDPAWINHRLIEDGIPGWQVHSCMGGLYPFNNFDVSTGFHSLKQLEGFMGENIKESSVPFNIERKLTDTEIEEVIEYCRHDVEQTIKVFEATKSEFDAQLALIDAFELPPKLFNKTKAQLSAHILGAERSFAHRNDEFDFTIVDTLRLDKYKHIAEWFDKPENKRYNKPSPTGKTTIALKQREEIWGVPHDIGYGGIHGAIKQYQGEGLFIMSDIASMYPATMINYNFLSRNVHNPDKFRQIRDDRIVLKRQKDPKQLPYKIVLNSTYGASKDKHNPLYDPLMANNVCINGQLLIVDLLEKLEAGLGDNAQLIQSNTDGILVKLKNSSYYDEYLRICKEWEERSMFELEHDEYVKVFQKDVNNYVIIDAKGKYKSKGAYVKKLNKIDYDLPIVNKALIDYLVYDIPVEETINKCDDLIEFQKVSKITSLYAASMHGDKVLNERVLRVFASNIGLPGVSKIKIVMDKQGNKTERIEKIGNTPESCFIVNDNIIGTKVPPILDKTWYIDLAKKRLNDFLG